MALFLFEGASPNHKSLLNNNSLSTQLFIFIQYPIAYAFVI